MKQVKNELTKFFLTKYSMIIGLFIMFILVMLYLVFPIIFNYNNDQQTFSQNNWKQEVTEKQKSLDKKIQTIENKKNVQPRDKADLQSYQEEKLRLEKYKEYNINPPAQNNVYDNSLTITGLNKLVALSIILFSSMIISKEYTDKTIQTLFLQPISKRKIILSKIGALFLINAFLLSLFYLLSMVFSLVVSSGKYTEGLIVKNLNTGDFNTVNFIYFMSQLFIGDYIYTIIYSLIALLIIILFQGNLISMGIPILFLFGWSSVSGFLNSFLKSDLLIPNHWNLNEHFGIISQTSLESSSYGDSLIVSIITILILLILNIVAFKKIKLE